MSRRRKKTGRLHDWVSIGRIVVLLVVVVLVFVVKGWLDDSSAEIATEGETRMSPTQIEEMRQIGEWEFLSIADEELVDTVRRGFFSDDELIRIYYGTLRLGIDLGEAREGWASEKDDSISVLLPRVRLLDDDFIDEARTRSFYESGKWSDADRQALYYRAAARMRTRCLTPENIRSAEENASRQFAQMIRSMGFERVSIRFEE